MRVLKYVVISVFTIILFSVVSFAVDDVVVTVNGQGYSTISEALQNAVSGDVVNVVADTNFTTINVAEGVNFNVNPGVTITGTSQILNYGTTKLFGSVVRSDTSESNVPMILNRTGDLYVYGSIVNSNSRGNAITQSADHDGNIYFYGGSVSALNRALVGNNKAGVKVYNGTFESINYPDEPVITVPQLDGVNTFNDNGQVVYSWGPLYQIKQIVVESISWLILFVSAIVSNKLLLIFVIVIFVGVGVGLIKRICRS